MAENYVKSLTYYNQYTHQNEVVNLCWTVEDGFASVSEARAAVSALGQNPDCFAYISFNNQVFPATLETLNIEILIAQDYVWYRYDSDKMQKIAREGVKELPFTVTAPRIGSRWNDKMAQIMSEFDSNFSCTAPKLSKTKSAIAADCKVLFGIVMFDTMVPVFELNCFDGFFAESLTAQKLYRDGVIAYNPFSGQRDVLKPSQRGGYTFAMYLDGPHCPGADTVPRLDGPVVFQFERRTLHQTMVLADGPYPFLFVCLDQKYRTYIVSCYEVSAKSREWLIAETTPRRIISLLSDEITLRAIFQQTQLWQAVLTKADVHPVVSRVKAKRVDLDILPTDGEYMDVEPGEFDEEIAILRKVATMQTTYGIGEDWWCQRR